MERLLTEKKKSAGMLDSLNKEGTLMLLSKTVHACPTLAIFKLDKHFEIYLAQVTLQRYTAAAVT